ncbi:MAG: hypothetical protein C5B53_07030 [Candidatus Melainabacteria bacterium]|nr:MAG: hypothetical protein C5B53_07030 [Candidatus Melainabacteria bacterium]
MTIEFETVMSGSDQPLVEVIQRVDAVLSKTERLGSGREERGLQFPRQLSYWIVDRNEDWQQEEFTLQSALSAAHSWRGFAGQLNYGDFYLDYVIENHDRGFLRCLVSITNKSLETVYREDISLFYSILLRLATGCQAQAGIGAYEVPSDLDSEEMVKLFSLPSFDAANRFEWGFVSTQLISRDNIARLAEKRFAFHEQFSYWFLVQIDTLETWKDVYGSEGA